jgi:branched-chain amino acid transport system ATP-binding protein
MTVEENLMMGAFARGDGRGQIKQDLDRVYDVFPRLSERRRQAAGTLSGGEQQMCAIGRGLMSAPRLLIIDELSLGLSPILVEQLSNDLIQLADGGVAIFLVEQDVAAALKIAQTAFVMDRGVIIKQGPSKEVAADSAVIEAYMGGM